MPTLHRRALLLAGLSLPGAAFGRQEPDGSAGGSLFRRLFPNATGQNGYEELVAAADALRASRLFAAVEAQKGAPCPLALKRRVLRDPPVRRAMDLVRRGLSKPVASPHPLPSIGSENPEVDDLRRIPRTLLPLRMEALAADGDLRGMLDTARLGMRLASAMETGTFFSLLLGMSIRLQAVRPVCRHLGQLGAAECDDLARLAVEWLQLPDPLLRALAAARREDLTRLDELRTAPRAALEKEHLYSDAVIRQNPQMDLAGQNDRIRREIGDLLDLRVSATGMDTFAAARAWIEDHYDRIAAECRKPVWERGRVELGASDTPSGAVLVFCSTWPGGDTMQFTRDTAAARLVACHAAIERYRWEHDHLPPDLAALRLGEMTTDPFTGRALEYEVRDNQYRLASAGPARGPADIALDIPRVPFSLVPDDR